MILKSIACDQLKLGTRLKLGDGTIFAVPVLPSTAVDDLRRNRGRMRRRQFWTAATTQLPPTLLGGRVRSLYSLAFAGFPLARGSFAGSRAPRITETHPFCLYAEGMSVILRSRDFLREKSFVSAPSGAKAAATSGPIRKADSKGPNVTNHARAMSLKQPLTESISSAMSPHSSMGRPHD